jgi:outer membrane lipoprotein-sorting protein
VSFRNVRVNPDLSASLFRLELPKDVVVTRGFSVFGETR